MVFVWKVLIYYNLLVVGIFTNALQNALSDCIEFLIADNMSQV